MEPTEEPQLVTVSTIRAELFAILAEYSEKHKRRPFTFEDLVRRIAQRLNARKVIFGPLYQPSVFPNYGVQPELAALIRLEYWELFLQRIIAPAYFQRDGEFSSSLDLDSFVLTPYGMSVIVEYPNRIQVHDPTGYLANFANASPAPDPVLMRYLKEATHTFRDGHLLASVVLLATASDLLVNLVAKNIDRVQGGDWYNRTYKPNSDVKNRFNALIHKLSSDFSTDLERISLKDTLINVVPPVFQLIRTARNDIAHPSGREFTWNEVSGFLHCFVGYYLCLNKIIGVLAALPPAP